MRRGGFFGLRPEPIRFADVLADLVGARVQNTFDARQGDFRHQKIEQTEAQREPDEHRREIDRVERRERLVSPWRLPLGGASDDAGLTSARSVPGRKLAFFRGPRRVFRDARKSGMRVAVSLGEGMVFDGAAMAFWIFWISARVEFVKVELFGYGAFGGGIAIGKRRPRRCSIESKRLPRMAMRSLRGAMAALVLSSNIEAKER